jgi:probable rRNA maturation factor
MKIEVEVNNLSGDGFRKIFFEKVFRETLFLCQEELSFLKDKNLSVSVALVSSLEMKKINKEYRKKNSATDVLSFSEYASKKQISLACGKDIFLGEVIVCYNYIRKYSGSEKNARRETARVVSHGLLHLLGFRHSKKMFEIQDAVANKIK